MNNFIEKLIQRNYVTNLIRNGVYLLKGLRLHPSTRIYSQGEFRYYRGTTIGERCIVTVPRGAAVRLGHKTWINHDTEISAEREIIIGDYTTVQSRCTFNGDIRIGKSCIFAANVFISSGAHYFSLKPYDLIQNQDRYRTAAGAPQDSRVVIEDDCWVGVNSVVMPGCKIGRGVVVGANSIVTRDIEPYTVVAGAPAVALKKRLQFAPPEEISAERATDMPYFYAGFSQNNTLDKNPSHGHVTAKIFSIALGCAGKTQINLELEKPDDQPVTIGYMGASAKLTDKVSIVSFKIVDAKLWKHDFTTLDAARVSIKRAWVS